MDTQALYVAWTDLNGYLGATAAARDDGWTLISKHYQEAHRRYHTLQHVAALLQQSERMPVKVHDRAVLALSIWFHDLIYDTHASDNEVQSAAAACAWMQRAGLGAELSEQVAVCITATARHQLPSAISYPPDLPVFLDLDLGILSAGAEAYQHYAAAIRAEYAWVPAFTYRWARAGVLNKFLQREVLYFTDHFRTLLQARARHNLQRERRQLLFFF